jgi:hypothetical protein
MPPSELLSIKNGELQDSRRRMNTRQTCTSSACPTPLPVARLELPDTFSYVDPNVTSHMQVGWGPEKENKFLVSLGRRRYFDGKLFNSVYYGYSSTVYSNLVGVGPDAGFRWTSQNGFSIDIGMSFKAYYDTSSSTISITNKPGLRLSLGMAW